METKRSLESLVNRLENSCILITGGSGFIGSHLTQALIHPHIRLVIVAKDIPQFSLFRQDDFKKKVTFEKVDIRNKKKIEELVLHYQPNFIIHLAAQTLVEEAYVHPVTTFEINILGTINVLEAARSLKRLQGIIVASSDKAYGKTKKMYTENSPLQGDHPYDVSKAGSDLISQAYEKTYDLPVVVTRFGNVYGEGDSHFNRIIPGLCKAVIGKETLTIRSNGLYVRDYIYAKDVAHGYLTLLSLFPSIRGEAYNFSSNDSLSVIALIKKAEQILSVTIPYRIANTARNEIPYQHLDDRKMRKLGWKTQYTLETALPGVYKWYESHIP